MEIIIQKFNTPSKTMRNVIDTNLQSTYRLCEKIGKGSFAGVFRGIHKDTGENVAIKIIDLESCKVEDVQLEITILSQCKCKYIIEYYGSYLIETNVWIVMEFITGGSVLDLLRINVLDELTVAYIIKRVLKGLCYLHNDGKIHRDIKPENIILSKDGNVKLIDFGLSGQLTDQNTKKYNFVGTIDYMAPEIIDNQLGNKHGYNQKVDIWSLGIVAIEMVKGKTPYIEFKPMKVLYFICKKDPPTLDDNFSTYFKHFVMKCLEKNPTHRYSANDLLKHKFITNTKKLRKDICWDKLETQKTNVEIEDKIIQKSDTIKINWVI